jgi:hypothetical protein
MLLNLPLGQSPMFTIHVADNLPPPRLIFRPSTTTAPATATDSEPLGIAPAPTEGEYEVVVETSGTPSKVGSIDMASEIAIQLPIDVPVAKIKGSFQTPQELVSHLAQNYYLKVDASGKTVTNRFILKRISASDKWEILLDEQ